MTPPFLQAMFLIASGLTTIAFAYMGVGYVVELRQRQDPGRFRRYFMVGWFTTSFVMSGFAAIKKALPMIGF